MFSLFKRIAKISLKRIDKNLLTKGRDEILCFCCIRNERLRLPWFLEFHRKIGLDRFFIVDNGSSDGSTEFLLSQNDVHLFQTEDSYAASQCGINWINTLLEEYAIGNWALVLDVDELFIYPNCEDSSLHLLTSYLEERQFYGMAAFMLDMYSRVTIKDAVIKPGDPFLDVCSYFDIDTYQFAPTINKNVCIPIRGGVRKRVFWDGKKRKHPAPYLHKYPLVKWQNGLSFTSSTHFLNQEIEIADISATILHFKYFSDFHSRAKEEVKRKEHWEGASEYRVYLEIMENQPNLTLHYDKSVSYKNSSQLLELGFMKVSYDYLDVIRKGRPTSIPKS